MTGWRIGLLFAPENINKHILKVHQYNVTCATSIAQMAALEALTIGINDALPMKEAYLERRDYVYDRLNKMGLDVQNPDGAFYFFVKIPFNGISSFDFCLSMVKRRESGCCTWQCIFKLRRRVFPALICLFDGNIRRRVK